MQRYALISVSDKSGIVEYAEKLSQLGLKILSTGGTFKVLQDAGVEVLSVEEYTGQKEILNGRVKTLHPKIHAGTLARRDDSAHMQQLKDDGINPIDLLVVNLYPFEEGLKNERLSLGEMVELIDVGGPSMIRGAAKNFSGVMTLVSPEDYESSLQYLTADSFNSDDAELYRKQMAAKAFARLADYNLKIAEYLSLEKENAAPRYKGFLGELKQELRYGENPHQAASFYKEFGTDVSWKQLNGKALSYNNLLDVDAGMRIVRCFKGDAPTVVILKHLNPCGAAQSESLSEAFKKAKTTDPRSHFGGIVVSNIPLDKETAELVVEDFKEIVISPGYSDEAVEILKTKKNLRVIDIDPESVDSEESRTICEGMLVQQPDDQILGVDEESWASGILPNDKQLLDLNFAWKICAHVKSNAIVLAKDLVLIGVGAGQMSRIDSTEVALANTYKHGHSVQGSVAASDAFFPFTDNIETLAEAGVAAVIAPSGAKKDAAVVEAAKKLGIIFGFAANRHFRH